MLLSLFSNADINVYHIKIRILINKIVTYTKSQRMAHIAEVTHLHHKMDNLADKLIEEQHLHESTKRLLDNVLVNFDKRTSKVIIAHGQILSLQEELQKLNRALAGERKGFTTRRKRLSEINASLHRTLSKISNILQTLQKKPHIADYEELVQ